MPIRSTFPAKQAHKASEAESEALSRYTDTNVWQKVVGPFPAFLGDVSPSPKQTCPAQGHLAFAVPTFLVLPIPMNSYSKPMRREIAPILEVSKLKPGGSV